MAHSILITKAPGKWSVRAGGAVLGESENALELEEDGYAPVIYFPRSDVAMAFLDQTDKTSHCPHKGAAQYFSVVTKSTTLENAVWSYVDPTQAAERIKDHLAFYTGDGITVEKI
ncbi:MAG: DUF427 domain-containing protein [Paracoccaceae bacterium]